MGEAGWRSHPDVPHLKYGLLALLIMLITCSLAGGLGNQLFQIANAYALAKHLDVSFGIIEGQFAGAGAGHHPSKYYENLFRKVPRIHVDRPLVTFKEPTWIYTCIIEDVKALLNPSTLLRLEGYFQSDQYFLDYSKEIRELFTPQESIQTWLKTHTTTFQSFPELFEPHDFCFIGVRRGDYITKANFHNPCGIDYFQKAMNLFPATRYYIGSDDIAWCRENFKGDQFVFFDIADDLVQFYLGCLFKNYIISNSTFHWWMSFLSVYENPLIIAPDKWMFGPRVQLPQYSSIYRKGMIVIQREV
jgi:hypothetical protein